MSFVSFKPMIPHLLEAKRLLREKYKFSAKETEELMAKVFWHFGDVEVAEQPKNPRRALLETVRKFAAAKRRQEKAWATRNKSL